MLLKSPTLQMSINKAIKEGGIGNKKSLFFRYVEQQQHEPLKIDSILQDEAPIPLLQRINETPRHLLVPNPTKANKPLNSGLSSAPGRPLQDHKTNRAVEGFRAGS